MTDLTPGLLALKDELMPAFRRDHQRHRRRRRAAHTAAIGVAALAALTGTALGAGSALGIIDLGGGASATQVTTLPVWNGTTGTFDSGTADGQYIYELAGVGADVFVCGGSTPYVATFITSSQPLSQSDLESALDPSTPTGLASLTVLKTLGITPDGAGCFPASVAGPLGTLQTPSQRAAAEAFQQKVLAQFKGEEAADTQRLAHQPRLRYVTVIHDGKRVIVKLSGKARVRADR